MSIFNGFYKLSRQDKLNKLMNHQWIKSNPYDLSDHSLENMIENVIGSYKLPMGVAVNFIINHKDYVIPMVIEEASVVAAASHAAKILGNITSNTYEREIIGQIIFSSMDLMSSARLSHWFNASKDRLLILARELSVNMVARGGGPKDIVLKQFGEDNQIDLCLYLTFDPCDAMGANSINTVLEGLGQMITEETDCKPLMTILSNYQEHALTKAQVRIPIRELHSDSEQSYQLAHKIVQASHYAQVDVYRAVTHNKGIMNGIDAVLMATANDWRAVEAGIHAFASRNGRYQGLSHWQIQGNELVGSLEIPLAIATVGGSISSHDTAQWSLELLNYPNTKELSEIICAVGLAQNFAALRALVSEGIQRGHMSMQARNIAISVGAKGDEIQKITSRMIENKQVNREYALELLLNLKK